jgi:hypothetical protein
LRQHGYDGQIAVTTHTTADARKLSHAGVARIIHPFEDAADFAARTLFDDDYLERKQ